jgi:hypothetical protein
MPKIPRPQAEDALMEYLEDWAANLGARGAKCDDGKKYYPSRQMTGFRKLHKQGLLLDPNVGITNWIDSYKFRPSAATRRMEDNTRDITDGGHTMWEQGLIDPSAPWAEYVTPQQRKILQDKLINIINRNVISRLKLRAQLGA